ncbi:MAG: HAD domain-containing protein [Prevotella sp.]|jgi:hypothetical protein
MSDEYGTIFDPNSVAYLRKIIEEIGAGIVVTYSWKEFMSFMDLDDMCEARHLPGFIVGTTPTVMNIDREDKILEWRRRHPKTKSYVIFDDMPLGKLSEEQAKLFFQIDPNVEITKEHAERAVRILLENIMNISEFYDRLKCCIYEQAIGDALGLDTEGMTDKDMAW